MAKVAVKGHQLYSSAGTAPVTAALNDILAQRMDYDKVGKPLRVVSKSATAAVEDIGAEHKRLIELYSPKDDQGKAKPIRSIDELTNVAAFNHDYNNLLDTEFEIETVPVGLLKGMMLAGATWASPLIDDAGEKKEATVSPDAE